MEPLSIEKGAELIRAGKLVAFPTETVYGLGGDALNRDAIGRIYRVKRRPTTNPLICHLPDAESVFRYATPTPLARALTRYWPGPLTLILPHEGKIPLEATAGSPFAAFRVPNHPVALELLRLCDRPVAAPSANLSGRRSPVTAAMVEEQLAGEIDGIVDGGRCDIGLESTVVKLMDDAISILRPGAITAEMLEQDGFTLAPPPAGAAIESPGQLDQHYAPATPLILLVDTPAPGTSVPLPKRIGLITFHATVPPLAGIEFETIFDLSSQGRLDEAAKNLFYIFNDAEKASLDALLVVPVPQHDAGRAINDRLKRAARWQGAVVDGRLIVTDPRKSNRE